MMPERSSRVIACALLVALLSLCASDAAAQSSEVEPARITLANCDAATIVPAEGAARDEAFALYAESRERYAEGDFAGVVELLSRAYAIHPEPVLLYNLARTLEGMARWGEAADAYECYVRRAPDARDRGAIEQRIETLRRSDDRARMEPLPDRTPERAREAPVTTDGASDRDAQRSLEAGPFVLLGAGAAVAVAGAIVGGLALQMRDDADASAHHADALQLFRTSQDFATAATITWSVAGALLLGGLIWGIVDWTAPQDPHVHVALGPTSLSLTVELR